MMQQGLLGELLSLNAGVRLQHGSQYGNEWVPQAGVIVHGWEGSEFKFSFSKGFRAPNIRELYMYPPHNPDLRPETMLNYEASLRQRFLEGRLEAGVAFYFINGRDMIQTVRPAAERQHRVLHQQRIRAGCRLPHRPPLERGRKLRLPAHRQCRVAGRAEEPP